MPALPMHRLRRYVHVRVVLDAEPDMRGSFHSAAPPQADEALGAAAELSGMPKSENVANTTRNLPAPHTKLFSYLRVPPDVHRTAPAHASLSLRYVRELQSTQLGSACRAFSHLSISAI